MRRFVLTPGPDEVANDSHDVVLPNLGALQYATVMAEKGDVVTLYDWWEDTEACLQAIEKEQAAGMPLSVDLYAGYCNAKRALACQARLAQCGIDAPIRGSYTFLFGQDYCDTSVLAASGIPCDTSITEGRSDYRLYEPASLDRFFAIQAKQNKPRTLSLMSHYGGCIKGKNCLHCSSSKDVRVPAASADNFMRDVAEIHQAFGLDELLVSDLMLSGKRTIDFAEARKRHDITRLPRLKISTSVNQVTPESIAAMKDINCSEVFLGVECYVDDLLRNLGKPFTTKEIKRAMELLHEANIHAYVSIMLGAPGENLETLKTTRDFLASWQHQQANGSPFMVLQTSIMTPVPGSELYDQLLARIGETEMRHHMSHPDWINRMQHLFMSEAFDEATIRGIKDTYQELAQLSRRAYARMDDVKV